jgi:hypothetical protein
MEATMVEFICLIEHKQVPDGQLPEQYRSSFDKLKSDVNGVIGSLTCAKHGTSPVVALNWTDGKVKLIGLRPCCEDFGKIQRDMIDRSTIALPKEANVINPDGTVTMTLSKWVTLSSGRKGAA